MRNFCLTTMLLLMATGMNVSAAGTEKAANDGKEVMKVEITNDQIDVIEGLVYSQPASFLGDRQMKMTLLVPRTKEPKPVVVYYPGGGFFSADNGKFIEMRMALAQAGFVVASVEYRVVPFMFPSLVVDAKAAVRYLRAHASRFGIDPARIGVLGDSAGGYVSQMMGTTNGEKQFDEGDYLDFSSDVQAAVTIYGISNLLNIGEGYSEAIQKVHESPSVTEALLVNGFAFGESAGNSITADKEKALKASPMGHVKENMPPFLIMHGSADKLVSPFQSEQLYNALKEKGNKVDYVVVDGAGHADTYWFQKPIIDKVVGWFKTNLMGALR